MLRFDNCFSKKKLYAYTLFSFQFYLKPFREKANTDSPILSAQEISILFVDVEKILTLQQQFSRQLDERVRLWHPNQKVRNQLKKEKENGESG